MSKPKKKQLENKSSTFTINQIQDALNRGGREFEDVEDLASEAQDLMDFFDLFPRGYDVTLFRTVHSKSENEVCLDNPGIHWTHSEHKALEFASDNLSRPWFLISASVSYENIDWPQSLFQNIHHPHEEELYVLSKHHLKKIKIKRVK